MTKPTIWLCSLALGALFTATSSVSAQQKAEPAAADADFFRQQVQPVLARRCWECHGPDVQESDLRLDSRQAFLKGGSSGQAVAVAGQPGASLLLQVLSHEGDVQMPPDQKLPPGEMDVLARWVRQGLVWPAGDASQPPSKEQRLTEQAEQHWAFQPIGPPALPSVRDADWVAQPIDRYILAALEQQQLSPSPPADRYTLIRRLKFDLLGLPPTFEEVEAFVHDADPRAYEKLVDRYLSSPQYGERWGRHWLDVARYADTKGYAFTRDRRYPFAYTYRDYVIRALNEDLPYDQFVLEQLAADLLDLEPDSPSLAALGFLTVGRKYNNRHLDIDDQIDVVGRGLLGLTLACARCHDHKYDPVPTEDYYSLYGVFASSAEPDELPVLGQAETTPGYEQYRQKLEQLQADRDQFLTKTRDDIVATAQQHAADYLARALTRESEEALQAQSFIQLKGEQARVQLVQHWRRVLAGLATADHPVLGPLFELIQLPDDQYTERAEPILAKWRTAQAGTEPGQVNPLVQQLLAGDALLSKLDLARLFGQLLTASVSTSASPASPAQEQVRAILVGPGSLSDLPPQAVTGMLTREEGNKHRELERLIEAHQVDAPGSPPRAMVLRENSPHNPHVFIRGNPARVGKAVPRQFLLALAGPERTPFQQASGRLELARRIVDPKNPLTARVIVNRVWMHHFGSPLVRTPSDFGIRCDAPVHQDVLDYLADQLVQDNWSLKRLHRALVLSSTYRQASWRRPRAEQQDPENVFCWRMNPRRLEFEAMHDALLAVSGQLDLTLGGRPARITEPPFPPRRAVYGYIDRQDLPGLYRVFDLASPDQSCPRRRKPRYRSRPCTS